MGRGLLIHKVLGPVFSPPASGLLGLGSASSPYPLFALPAIILGMEVYRIQEEATLYYLTFTVVYWLPVFVSAETCLILTESLNFCH
jgi:hypothetical protein